MWIENSVRLAATVLCAAALTGLSPRLAEAASPACATISDCAYREVNGRAVANQSSFFVYLDADSAFNHGYASGLFFSEDVNPSSVVIDPGCLDSPASATGCATDPNLIDQTRGTVLRISFPALGPSDYVGLNFQDPQNYASGDGSSGYNLAPANAVQFDVRSPSGARVQFGVGGCVTGFLPIRQAWQTLTIPLNTLYPPPGGSSSPCPQDITNTHVLFTVTTNGGQQAAASTVLLDNIQFTPVPARQSTGHQALSLPISTQTFGVIPAAANPVPPDQANRNVAAIYESSLAILTLLKRGQSGDIANALDIADAMDYALHHDNHGDPVPPGSDGSVGLHSAYMAGDIGLLNTQSAQGAQAGDARLAGFSGGATLCGTTGFCLVLDGATGGNNAWAMFGLISAYLQSGQTYYLTDAETIGGWIINRLQDQSEAGFHGYFVGFDDSSAEGLQQPNFGKSTENNGDIFGAFTLLSQIEAARGNSAASQKWLMAAKVAGDFVASMQTPSGGFYVGTVTAADALHPAAGNCPSTAPAHGNDVINTCEFIDSDTFTILPMAAAANYSSIGWAAALQHVLNYSVAGATYTQTVTAAGQSYQGFDLVPAPPDTGVAFEFTGQVAATCFYLDSILSTTTFQSCGNTYLSSIANAQMSAPFGDGNGLVASVLQNGGTLPLVNQCLSTPFQCIPERVGLAATAWAIITDQKFNPMAYPGALFNQSAVTFGSQTTGSSSPATALTLTNAGTAPMTITGIPIVGANSADFHETDTCVPASPLAPGVACTISVSFQPTAAGTRTAALSLVTNAFAGPLSLSGQAVPIDDFSLSVSPANQSANAGGSASYTVSTTITAGATQTVTLFATGLPPAVTASFAANPISSGASTQLTVSPAIGAAPGSYPFTVSGSGPEVSHASTAAIAIQPALVPSKTALIFSTQTVGTTSAAQPAVISNPGPLPLSLVILVAGPNSGEFTQTNNCSSPLPPLASCMVDVSFTPAGTGPRSAWLQIESTSTAGQTIPLSGVGTGNCLTISGCALQELGKRVSANAGSFFAFKDADSGFNHGTPSGVFASGVDTMTVIINAGCVDMATSPTGCSSDPAAIDESRGTVLGVTFPGLVYPQYAGLNIQEPSDYSPLVPSAGYNLTPATSVQFDARSPQGATVRFGVGGCVTPYTTLPPTWTTIVVPLNSLIQPGLAASIPCVPDLTNVNLLFAISADFTLGAGGGTVLLDNIQFVPVPSRQASAASLPLSTETYGVVPQPNYPIPTDQVNRNLATTYESALATLAFLARGDAQDISDAMNVANAFDYALHHDNHGDPIPVMGGSAGLHSSYEAGDLAFLDPQAPSVGAGQAGDVRLSGFSASISLCGDTKFCLVLDGATGGNNAWAILALAVAYEHTGISTYLMDAEAIGNWVAALADSSGNGFGGYYLGYSDGGLPKQRQVGKSTEQNADIFAAFNLLAQIESLRGDSALAASWAARAKIAGDFVIKMFDAGSGRFNTGTVNNIFTTGPVPGICPSATQIQGDDTVNTCDFLDANTAPILAMSGSALYEHAIHWSAPAQYLSTFSQTVSAAGGGYRGFGLIPAPAGTGVTWEYTSQAVAAYETGLLPNSSSLANTYLQEIAAAQNAAPFGDGLGIVASTLQNGDMLPPTGQCLNTPFQCVPERVGIAATSWAALVDRNVNPLSPGVTPISLSSPALSFGPQQFGSAAAAQVLSVTNLWTVPVNLAVSITGTNATDFSQTGCQTMLATGASCSLTVGFIPTATGPRSASISVAQTPSWALLPFISVVALSGTGTSQTCTGTCGCSACPASTIVPEPASLLFTAPMGGSAPAQTITITYQTYTQGQYTVSATINYNTGTGWLNASPGSVALNQVSSVDSLYTYSGTIQISANAGSMQQGSYAGFVTISGAGTTAQVETVLAVVAPAPLTIVPASLNISWYRGDPNPPPVPVSAFSNPPGQNYTAAVTSGANWITVGNSTGTAPSSVTAGFNLSSLTTSTSGQIAITPAVGAPVLVPVNLSILSPHPAPAVSPSAVSIIRNQGGVPSNGIISVSNQTGGTVNYTATAAAEAGSWLKLAGTGSGSASLGSASPLPFIVDPIGLQPGSYAGHITVTDVSTEKEAEANVMLAVSAPVQSLLLSQTGITFHAAQHGPLVPSQGFSVFAPGLGPVAWTATTQAIANALSTNTGWIHVLNASGVSSADAPATVIVSVDQTGLSPGQYFGAVSIDSAGAVNSPQVVSVLLVVDPDAQTRALIPTAGVILSGVAGNAPSSPSAARQAVALFNPAPATMAFSASAFTSDGAAWLSVNPTTGTLSSGANTLDIQANPALVTSGVWTGSVRIAFEDGSVGAIQVVLIASSDGAVPNVRDERLPQRASRLAPRALAACSGGTAGTIVSSFAAPMDGATVTATVAQHVQLVLTDDCGNPVSAKNGATAEVTFNSGYSALSLNDMGGGVWEGTWVPANVSSQVTLTLAAAQGSLASGAGMSSITVAVLAAPAGSAALANGVVNAAGVAHAQPQVAASGSYIEIYGINLAGTGSPNALGFPLPVNLNSTQVFLGPWLMPLLYAGPGQINAEVPQELTPYATYPLIVRIGATTSVPLPITVVADQPGIYTLDGSGSGQGIVQIAASSLLAAPPGSGAARAIPGVDTLVIYCTGLGPLAGSAGGSPPADGVAADLSQLYETTAKVNVTLGGMTVPAAFAGLSPTFVALYQVNVPVPAGAPAGDAVPLSVSVTDPATGVTVHSNTVTVALQ